jgi:hypothetical protein
MSSTLTAIEIKKGKESLEGLQKWLPHAQHDEQDNGNWKYKNNGDLEAKVMPLLKDLGLQVCAKCGRSVCKLT